jgi:hypothetical protein
MSLPKRRALGIDALDGLIPMAAPAEPVSVPTESVAPAAVETLTVVPVLPVSSPAREPVMDEEPAEATPATEPVPVVARVRRVRASEPAPAGPREKITFALPKELIESCRDAVDYLSGPPVRLTLAGLVERALKRELDRLQREHGQGNPFPTRAGTLRTGRPMRR